MITFRQLKIISLSVGIGAVILMPHLTFEIAEELLDLLVEAFFHTGTHATQIITFYVLLLLFCYWLYKLYRYLQVQYHHLKIIVRWAKYKALSAWRKLSVFKKINIVGLTCVSLSLIFF